MNLSALDELDHPSVWAASLESWPEGLFAKSIPSTALQLTRDEMLAIGSSTPEFALHFGLRPGQPLPVDLRLRIASALRIRGKPVVPRLGACSWKSEWRRVPVGGTPDSIINILRSPNGRVARLLAAHIQTEQVASLFLRSWIEIPIWSETRVFVQHGQVIGAVQTYGEHTSLIELETFKNQLESSIDELISCLHHPDLVLDVGLDAASSSLVIIETNPFHYRTHEAPFNWRNPSSFDGSYRFKVAGTDGWNRSPLRLGTSY